MSHQEDNLGKGRRRPIFTPRERTTTHGPEARPATVQTVSSEVTEGEQNQLEQFLLDESNLDIFTRITDVYDKINSHTDAKELFPDFKDATAVIMDIQKMWINIGKISIDSHTDTDKNTVKTLLEKCLYVSEYMDTVLDSLNFDIPIDDLVKKNITKIKKLLETYTD